MKVIYLLLILLFQHGWKKNLDVNLYGASYGVFLAIEKMGTSRGGKGGRIVNIASVAGITVCNSFPDLHIRLSIRNSGKLG